MASRSDLLDQLAYLADEMEALRGVVDLVPPVVLNNRPVTGEPSLRELWLLLALRDRHRHLPLARALHAGTETPPDLSDDDALLEAHPADQERPIEDVLEAVQQGRHDLVAVLRGLPDERWQQGGAALAHAVTQADTDTMRMAGYRLHESNLTRSQEDLPK